MESWSTDVPDGTPSHRATGPSGAGRIQTRLIASRTKSGTLRPVLRAVVRSTSKSSLGRWICVLTMYVRVLSGARFVNTLQGGCRSKAEMSGSLGSLRSQRSSPLCLNGAAAAGWLRNHHLPSCSTQPKDYRAHLLPDDMIPCWRASRSLRDMAWKIKIFGVSWTLSGERRAASDRGRGPSAPNPSQAVRFAPAKRSNRGCSGTPPTSTPALKS